MRPRCLRLVVGGIVAASLAGATVAEGQYRTLYWESLSVEARLEESGALHVIERHAMVFDGDWNGGERTFGAGSRTPDLISLARVDPDTGKRHPLRPSSSPGMGKDEYAWSGPSTLRWRARRPSDPPFRDQRLTYLLEYRMYDVLRSDGAGHLIHHDFAFADRPGVIRRYTLDLTLDRAWKPAPGSALTVERANLAPGESVGFDMRLTRARPGTPKYLRNQADGVVRAVPRSAPVTPPPVRSDPLEPAHLSGSSTQHIPHDRSTALASLFVVGMVVIAAFVRRQSALGCHEPLPEVTLPWLEEHLFQHRPEVVGAAWDGEVGQAEAAALIAILATEGKIENNPGTPARLTLLVPRDSLHEYERAFVDRLFVAGDEIDTDTLRRHYQSKSVGFDPSDAIRPSLEVATAQLLGARSAFAAGLGFLGVIPISLVALSIWGTVPLRSDSPALVMLMVAPFGAVMYFAARYRQRFTRTRAVLIGAPLLVQGVVLTELLWPGGLLVAYLVLTLLAMVVVFLGARWTGTRAELETLRSFQAARAFFKRRLRQPDAVVEEAWLPYILAFGLGKDLDRWSVAAPARSSGFSGAWPTRSARGGSGSAGSSSGSSFEGGGGAFGGAGASGGWASSIGSFAAVVASPRSSSSSSSGGGSSSSRSGGGGGGGW